MMLKPFSTLHRSCNSTTGSFVFPRNSSADLLAMRYFFLRKIISEEVDVPVLINKIERIARYAMGSVAILAVLTWVAFEFGWIATMPSYKKDAWYLVGGNTHFVITNEYADEAACRRDENISAVCLQGKVLMEEARRNEAGG